MDNLHVESFNPEVCSTNFSCGNDRIDYIFKNYCAVLEREGKATTKLFYKENKLIGFCTLLADRLSISPTDVFLQGEYPAYYPAVQLYSIGVHSDYQSEGIGSAILEWIIALVYQMKENIGVSFLLLESFNDMDLLKFYTRNGFDSWRYLEKKNEELIPMVYDYRGLNGVI